MLFRVLLHRLLWNKFDTACGDEVFALTHAVHILTAVECEANFHDASLKALVLVVVVDLCGRDFEAKDVSVNIASPLVNS